MSQLRVFVSHSSQDKDFTDALVKALRAAGADVWYDQHNLEAGPLVDGIAGQLKSRPVFIVVLSKAAFASEWVGRECRWAYNLYYRDRTKRIILPVVASAVEPSDFDAMLFLEDFTRIEAPGHQPYARSVAVERTLRMLALVPASPLGNSMSPETPSSVDETLVQARALEARQEYDVAIGLLRQTTDVLGKTATATSERLAAWAMLAETQIDAGQYAEALDTCDGGLIQDAEQATLWAMKGRALRHLGRMEEAAQASDRAWRLERRGAQRASKGRTVTKRPTGQPVGKPPSLRADDLVQSARALITKEQYEAAVRDFKQASYIAPDNCDVWVGLGVAYIRLGDWYNALGAYERAQAIRPQDAVIMANRANALVEQECYQQGLEVAQCAIRLQPKSAAAWTAEAHARVALHDYDAALASVAQAHKLQPDLADTWAVEAEAHLGLGQYSDALVAAKQAIDREPKHARAWTSMAWVYLHIGDYLEALGAATQAVAIRSNLADAWLALACAHTGLGQDSDALEAVERASGLMPDMETALRTLEASALNRLGRYEEALVAADRAISLDPELRPAWANKAASLHALGRDAEAHEAEHCAKASGGLVNLPAPVLRDGLRPQRMTGSPNRLTSRQLVTRQRL